MEPKLILIAIYDGTQTLANVCATKRCLLQLLTRDLAPVVRVCGKLSGTNIDKIARLQKRYKINEHNGLPFFTQAAGFMELELQQMVSTPGDHQLAVCKVVSHTNLHDTQLLTTDWLKRNNYIR